MFNFLFSITSLALMSDSYERIQDQSRIEFYRLRASLIDEIEYSFSPAQLKSETLFPKYLHILVPKDSAQTASRGAWMGVLNDLKRELKREGERRQSEMVQKFSQLDSQTVHLEHELLELHTKFDRFTKILEKAVSRSDQFGFE